MNDTNTTSKVLRAALFTSAAAIATAFASTASAESFALNEFSTIELGHANAGAVVQTDDASAAFANPALLPLYDRSAVTGALSGVWGDDVSFSDRGSTDATGAPLGGDTDDFLSDAYIPALHAVYAPGGRWAFGLSLAAPYGLSTSYDADWPGRYQALDSDLTVIDLSPSVGYQLTDTVSIGGGLNIQYVEAKLTNALDFGAVCLGALPVATCAGAGLLPQAADGNARVEGDDVSIGYNLGVAWTPTETVRVGVHYRSEIAHELEGDADFTVPANAAPLTATGLFADSDVEARLDLPATLEVGVMWQATEKTRLYFDVRQRYWSSLQEIRIKFDNPAQPDSVETLAYEDTVKVAAGVDYAINPAVTLRAGVALDETSTQSDHRLARITDDDRTYYALGASWTPNPDWQIDAAYNRVDIDSHDFDQTGDFNDRVVGRAEGAANVLSLGVTRRF